MILIVYPANHWSRPVRFTRVLRTLGIPYTLAYAGTGLSDNLQTPAGSFVPASPELRDYFRQFRAVFVAEAEALNFNGLRLAHHWLGWNDSQDTPIVYFGWNFAAERGVPLPSDFPVVAPQISDINSGIANQQQPSTAIVLDNFKNTYNMFFARAGVAVRLMRENADAYIPTLCWLETTTWRTGIWRLDTAKHAALGSQGEVLAIPAPQPDETYPANALIAYRYKNRYLLPMIRPAHQLNERSFPDLFWLLYALKLIGVQPLRKLPVYWETDHPIQPTDGGTPRMPDATMLTIQRNTWAWLRDFCLRTGMVSHNGITSGGMARRRTVGSFHWNLVHATRFGYPELIEQLARQIHEILLAGHREGTTPCGIHDHSTDGTRGFWGYPSYTNFERHAATDYATSAYNPGGLSFPLEAPNNVPKKRGRCCVAKHVVPAGAIGADATKQRMGDAEYYEWDYEPDAYTGSAINLGTIPAGSIHAARLMIESNIAEMLALGFPDGHGGEHGYTNCAANNGGGDYYWQAAREYGYKALRTTYHCNIGGNVAMNKAVPPNTIWRGFHLIEPFGTEWIVTGSRGLYAPNNTDNAVMFWGLDLDGDISTGWPNTAWRAHRRVLTYMTALWFGATASLTAPVVHPVTFWAGASPTDTVARFDGANILNWFGQPHWNPQVELLENMRVIIGVLGDYLKFGSVSDVILVREQVLR